jgi:TolA-binding protein
MVAATRTARTLRSALLASALLALLAGCRERADDILATAQLEELQHNPVHARELYTDLVRRYPGTPQAATAAARLEALETAAPPASRGR